jgi:hypothetical protein
MLCSFRALLLGVFQTRGSCPLALRYPVVLGHYQWRAAILPNSAGWFMSFQNAFKPRRMRPTQVAPEPGGHSVTSLKQATATSQFLERLPRL